MGCSDLGERLSGVAKGLDWVLIVPLVSLTPQTLIPVAGEGGSPMARCRGWVPRWAGALSVAPSPSGPLQQL